MSWPKEWVYIVGRDPRTEYWHMPKFKDKKDVKTSAKDRERGLEEENQENRCSWKNEVQKEKWWTVSDVADKTWTENWQ